MSVAARPATLGGGKRRDLAENARTDGDLDPIRVDRRLAELVG
jgi:hypothetical protein